MKLLVLALFFISCSCIKYAPDTEFKNSSQANSFEYLVRINGEVCKDITGKVGACAIGVKSEEKIDFSFDSRPYGYRLKVECSSAQGFEEIFDVAKDMPFSFNIVPSVKQFSCIGEIFPVDRKQSISAKWYARLLVQDSDYEKRETPYVYTDKKKKYLVMGSHSKYLNIDGKDLDEKTVTLLKNDNVKAYSESEMGRFNYYGY